MLNFEYYTPTKVVFGKGTEKRAGELARSFGASKVLVHYGGGSAKKSGLLDRVCDSLTEAGLPYVLLGGVVPNPRLGLVKEGIELCKKKAWISFWPWAAAASSIPPKPSATDYIITVIHALL